MLLSNVLRKENNNMDIFRVVAAFMVIYGHAYAIISADGSSDVLGRFLVFDYSGSLAVKIFFFLSGLVVTNSLLERRDVRQFVVSRFFRLWPALVIVLGAWAFILGPMFSTKSLQQYFSDFSVYEYFLRGVLMDIRFDLPGVFQENAFKSVNGSLWSIPFEVYAYIALIAAFLLGAMNSKPAVVLFFLVILIDPILDNKLLFTWLPQNKEVALLAPCFALGSVFAVFKDKIKINMEIFIGAWVLYFLFKTSTYNFYFFYFSIFYSIVFISSRVWILKFKPTFDISYGVYLWGWPVQQVMAQIFPHYGVGFNQISSMIASALLGYASWKLVESRFIKIGSNISRKFLSHQEIKGSEQKVYGR